MGDFKMVAICPLCRSRNWNDVRGQFISSPCEFCGGSGKVDTEVICNCGRPAISVIRDEEEKVLGYTCTHFDCGKRLLEAKA